MNRLGEEGRGTCWVVALTGQWCRCTPQPLKNSGRESFCRKAFRENFQTAYYNVSGRTESSMGKRLTLPFSLLPPSWCGTIRCKKEAMNAEAF
jgi:hypothetical protein